MARRLWYMVWIASGLMLMACGSPSVIGSAHPHSEEAHHEVLATVTDVVQPPTLTPSPQPTTVTMASPSAARGEALFSQMINGAPSCASCHTVTDVDLTGPGLGGYALVAGTRVDGESAEEYTRYAITHPDRYILPGWSNVMYIGYGVRMSDEQIDDLVAYMLSLD